MEWLYFEHIYEEWEIEDVVNTQILFLHKKMVKNGDKNTVKIIFQLVVGVNWMSFFNLHNKSQKPIRTFIAIIYKESLRFF